MSLSSASEIKIQSVGTLGMTLKEKPFREVCCSCLFLCSFSHLEHSVIELLSGIVEQNGGDLSLRRLWSQGASSQLTLQTTNIISLSVNFYFLAFYFHKVSPKLESCSLFGSITYVLGYSKKQCD